jgi:hypothetical protein
MLTENEVGQLVEIPEIRTVVKPIYEGFIRQEKQFEHLSLHDFLSGLLITPSIALAMVDGTTSLFEELTLNKKARRFSKGGFFLQQDPVVRMVTYLRGNFHQWETKFMAGIKEILKEVIPERSHIKCSDFQEEQPMFQSLMKTPYILVRFLETFFLPEGEEITNKRIISPLEFEKINSLGDQLQLAELNLFRNFIKTFEVK